MDLIVHVPGDLALMECLKADGPADRRHAITFARNREALSHALRNCLTGETVVLYFAVDEADMAYLRSLQDVLFSVRLMLILASRKCLLITAAWALRPRMILYRDMGAAAIAEIVRKTVLSDRSRPPRGAVRFDAIRTVKTCNLSEKRKDIP